MRLLATVVALFLLSGVASGQTKAVTENGEEVILYNDGTWKSTAAPKPGWDTRLDTPALKKSDKATFLVKGKKLKYGVWIDPKKWKFSGEKNPTVPAAEYFFTMKDGDVYGMTVPEGIEVNFESLPGLALKMAQNIDPNAHIIHEETRKVNGVLVKFIELKASTQGIDFDYLGYYYSGPEGIVRLLVFTSQNLMATNRKTIEELLNGFTLDVK